MGPSAEIVVEQIDERSVSVTVGSDPLGDGADELAECVGRLLEKGNTRVVVEFDGSLLNSKLLDALVRAAARQPTGEPGGVAVIAPPSYVHQMHLVSATGGPVLLADTRDDALEALGEG